MRWINRTESSFSESFFQVFNWRYFLFTTALYGLPNITLQIPQEQSQRRAIWEESSISVRCITRTHGSFLESFFPVFNGRYFFFTITLYGIPNITLEITKNSLTERLLEGKPVTLWDELTEHKVVSQKYSFQFLTEDISFFTIAFYGLQNITLQITQEQAYRKPFWGESCNSVRWINRTQSRFSESLFSDSILG